MSSNNHKLKVAIFKFASCDGCQLTLLDAEDHLLAVAEAIDIAYFPEASRRMAKGPYDISFVEGSITTHHDADRIQQIRRQSKTLITLGACATAGGIQSLRNFADVNEYIRAVYAKPDFITTLKTSTPIAEHVPVDLELRGCPVSKNQFLEVVSATLAGRRPNLPTHSVCVDCKRNGTVCVAVSQAIPCLGPVTMAGCNALCPEYNRGCFGCFGPQDSANTRAWTQQLIEFGATPQLIQQSFRSFNAGAWQFRQASEEATRK
jgi:sulfhydrogenase subunit delta